MNNKEPDSDTGGRKLPPFRLMKNPAGRSGGRSFSFGDSTKMKSNRTHYNPAEIKKQREFYKNAKHIKKYKKLKQKSEKTNHESDQMRIEPIDPVSEETNKSSRKMQRKKNNLQNLREEYEKKRQEEEKARMEAEAIREAKRAEKEKIVVQKKDLKHKMLKRTRSGQPIMKYRLDHLIETLQRSSN